MAKTHKLQTLTSLAGYSWLCSCGEGGETQHADEADALSEAYVHVRARMGLDDGIEPTEEECLELLARLVESGRVLDDGDLTGPTPRARVIAVLDVLDGRGWVQIANPLHGDDRLMSARGITPSALGRQAYTEALDSGAQSAGHDPEPGVERFDDHEQLRAARSWLMSRVYEATGGSTTRRVSTYDFGREQGWARPLTATITSYLAQEGLLKRQSLGGLVSITHEGVKEMERSLSRPDEATDHFASRHVVVNFFGPNLGAVQVATVDSTLSQTVTDVGVLRHFLHELSSAIKEAPVDEATRQSVQLNVELVEDALEREGPDSPTVHRALPVLRDFGVGIASSAAFTGLASAIAQLPI